MSQRDADHARGARVFAQATIGDQFSVAIGPHVFSCLYVNICRFANFLGAALRLYAQVLTPSLYQGYWGVASPCAAIQVINPDIFSRFGCPTTRIRRAVKQKRSEESVDYCSVHPSLACWRLVGLLGRGRSGPCLGAGVLVPAVRVRHKGALRSARVCPLDAHPGRA